MKWFLVILAGCIILSLQAEANIRYGVKTGFTLAQHYANKGQAEGYDVTPHMVPGACAGIFVSFPVTDRLSINEEVLYVMKGSREDIKVVGEPIRVTADYRMNYLEIPVLLDIIIFKSGQWTVSSTFGTAMGVKVGADYTLEGEVLFNTGDSLEVIPIREHSNLSDADLFDYSFVYGGRLSRRQNSGNLFLEYRVTFGMNAIELPTYSDNGTVFLRNQNYSLLLGYTF